MFWSTRGIIQKSLSIKPGVIKPKYFQAKIAPQSIHFRICKKMRSFSPKLWLKLLILKNPTSFLINIVYSSHPIKNVSFPIFVRSNIIIIQGN